MLFPEQSSHSWGFAFGEKSCFLFTLEKVHLRCRDHLKNKLKETSTEWGTFDIHKYPPNLVQFDPHNKDQSIHIKEFSWPFDPHKHTYKYWYKRGGGDLVGSGYWNAGEDVWYCGYSVSIIVHVHGHEEKGKNHPSPAEGCTSFCRRHTAVGHTAVAILP